MSKWFYITTAIDYLNGQPHLGHAYEKIVTDVIARVRRSLGQEVFYLTGLDEHGQKVQQAAVADSDLRSVQRSHFPHGIFEPEQATFAHVHAQHARKCAEAAWVWIPASQRPFCRQRRTVRANRAPRLK